MALQVELVSPERVLYSGEADTVLEIETIVETETATETEATPG